MDTVQNPARLRPLTRELEDTGSPVRRFFDERFSAGLRGVQGRYRKAAPHLVVGPGTANPGTVSTAADWLLRFLAHPAPGLTLPLRVAEILDRLARMQITPALVALAAALGVPEPALRAGTLDGPVPRSTADPELLARACWALALLTEAFRAGPAIAVHHPLAQRFRAGAPSAADLLELAPADAIAQLAALRAVFEQTLLPQLAGRRGVWALGPSFAGSRLMKADADLVAAGLLLELKTTAKAPSFSRGEAFQVIGYALLDFDDRFALETLALFSARCGYLAAWPLPELLEELAGHQTDLPAQREQFHALLLAAQPPRTG